MIVKEDVCGGSVLFTQNMDTIDETSLRNCTVSRLLKKLPFEIARLAGF